MRNAEFGIRNSELFFRAEMVFNAEFGIRNCFSERRRFFNAECGMRNCFSERRAESGDMRYESGVRRYAGMNDEK